MALFTLGEYTIKAIRQVGRQFKMLTHPIPSAVRAFSVLLFFTLFLPSNEGYAQTQVASLRDYHQVTENNYYNSRASTLRTNTTTSISLLVNGRALALVAISGVPVSQCKRKRTATIPIGLMPSA